MFHTIEFRVSGLVQLEVPGKAMPVQALIERGTRIRAQIKPYVVESDMGPIEVADLLSDDGSATRAVRFAHFRFIDL